MDGDGVQIQQVVLNLIRNGIEAVESVVPERRVVEVRATRWEEGGVRIEVADRGCGLPEGDEDLPFQRFFTTKENGP